MNTSTLFEITAVLVGLGYTAYLIYFRLSDIQARKYQKITGSTKDAYLKMFSKLKIGITCTITLILVTDLARRLATDKALDGGGVLLFTSLILGIGLATFISIYGQLSREKSNISTNV